MSFSRVLDTTPTDYVAAGDLTTGNTYSVQNAGNTPIEFAERATGSDPVAGEREGHIAPGEWASIQVRTDGFWFWVNQDTGFMAVFDG